MSRRRQTPTPVRSDATAATTQVAAAKPGEGGRRWRWVAWLAGGVILAGIAVGAWVVATRRSPDPLPQLDLSAVDPKVGDTIRQHLETVRRDPRSGSGWGWLGALLWVYDFRTEACVCLAEAERLDQTNPRWPYYHGLALMIATPQDAIPCFRRAVEICGSTPEAPRFRLARLLAEQGRWAEAKIELDALLAAHPEFNPARLLNARAAQNQGDVARAIELARACLNDARTTRAAWALLAILYRQQGDALAATTAAERSVTAATDEGFGDPFEAEVTLRRGDPRALSEQAHPLLAAGHLNEAAGLIDRLVKDHADYPDTWLLQGRLQLLRKDPVTAEKSLRQYLAMRPDSAPGLFQLGLALLSQNRFVEAAEVFGQATAHKRDFGPAYYNQAFALARAGQTNAAVAAFRESLRHNPERVDTYFLLADLHLRTGDKDEAAKLIDEAAAMNPKDPRLPSFRQRVRP